MAEISVQLIKELRDRTGIGMGKCKEALVAAGGDIEKAIADLRKSGMAAASKKTGRQTDEGMIGIVEGDSHVAIVEVNAETDFVVRNERFQQFLKDVSEEAAKTTPASLEEFLKQKFSKDSSMTIDEYRASVVQTIGENIQISRLIMLPKDDSRSVGVYSHMNGKIVCAVIVKGTNTETELAKQIALHTAAAHPDFLSPESVPESILESEREIARGQIKGKPPEIVDKILTGKINSFFDSNCLLRQSFIRDESVTIQELVEKRGKELGKDLQVESFIRWEVGQA